MIIDLLILIVVLGAAWIGFQKGLIQPLLAEFLGLGSLFFVIAHRDGFLGLTHALFHANAVLAAALALILAIGMGYLGWRLGGAIHKMPVVCGADGFFGVWVQMLMAIGFCYVLISGGVAMDKAFTPVGSTTTATVSLAQLRLLEKQLGSNPVTSSVVDTAQLQAFDAKAAKGGVTLAELPGVSSLEQTYDGLLKPQLAGSHLAPMIMSIGRHLPGVGGGYGPKDLPRKT